MNQVVYGYMPDNYIGRPVLVIICQDDTLARHLLMMSGGQCLTYIVPQ